MQSTVEKKESTPAGKTKKLSRSHLAAIISIAIIICLILAGSAFVISGMRKNGGAAQTNPTSADESGSTGAQNADAADESGSEDFRSLLGLEPITRILSPSAENTPAYTFSPDAPYGRTSGGESDASASDANSPASTNEALKASSAAPAASDNSGTPNGIPNAAVEEAGDSGTTGADAGKAAMTADSAKADAGKTGDSTKADAEKTAAADEGKTAAAKSGTDDDKKAGTDKTAAGDDKKTGSAKVNSAKAAAEKADDSDTAKGADAKSGGAKNDDQEKDKASDSKKETSEAKASETKDTPDKDKSPDEKKKTDEDKDSDSKKDSDEDKDSDKKNAEDTLTKTQKKYVAAWEESHMRSFPLNTALHDYNWKHLEYDDKGVLQYKGDDDYTVRHGIDVSEFQGQIDWDKVKKDGYDFAFIRVGHRTFHTGSLERDTRAIKNLTRAKKAGLDVGVYVFSQAITIEEAIEEAELCLDVIKESKVEITLPVVYDPEIQIEYDARINYITSKQFTDNAVAFSETIREAGYTPAIYANCSTETDILNMSRLENAEIWYADYNSVPESPYRFTFWQYTNMGWVDGIPEAETDLNLWFVKKE